MADTQSLIIGSECIDKCIPDGMKMAVLIKIFAGIAGVSTDPASLMAGAECVDRCIPDGYKMAVLIKLANQIAGNPA